MIQMVYISSARNQGDVDQLPAILAVSRRNNAEAGITGLLLANGTRFLQALEGPEFAVRRTFERIRKDPRHRAIVILSESQVTIREFGAWTMAEGGIDASNAIVDALVGHVPDANTRALFSSFARVKSVA